MISNFLYDGIYAVFTIISIVILCIIWLSLIDVIANIKIFKYVLILLLLLLISYSTFWIFSYKSERSQVFNLERDKNLTEILSFLKNNPKSKYSERVRVILNHQMRPGIHELVEAKEARKLKSVVDAILTIDKPDSVISILKSELNPKIKLDRNEKPSLLRNIKDLLILEDTILPNFSINVYYNLVKCPSNIITKVENFQEKFINNLLENIFPLIPETICNKDRPPYDVLTLQLTFTVEFSHNINYYYWRSGSDPSDFKSGTTSREYYYIRNINLAVYKPFKIIPEYNYFINEISPKISENNPPDIYLPISELSKIVHGLLLNNNTANNQKGVPINAFDHDINLNMNSKSWEIYTKELKCSTLDNGIPYDKDGSNYIFNEARGSATIDYKIASLTGFTYLTSFLDEEKLTVDLRDFGCLKQGVQMMREGTKCRFFVPPEADLGKFGQVLKLNNKLPYIITLKIINLD
jgi:hypothetical protein